jgi:hypothetical protein
LFFPPPKQRVEQEKLLSSRRGTKLEVKANASELVEIGEKIIGQENIESGHVNNL